MNNLGVMFEKGQSVAKDDPEAVKWFRKAAELGYAKAQNNLGQKYERGQGVRQDFVEAARWYRKAADQGFAGGETDLGQMYASGKGVERKMLRPSTGSVRLPTKVWRKPVKPRLYVRRRQRHHKK